MRAKWLLLAVGALLAGVLAGALSLWWQQRRAADLAGAAEADAPPPVTQLQLEGIVGARNVLSIPPPIPGTLEMVMVDVGTEVYEGMLLAQIANTTIESEMQLVQEELAEAETEANELDSLVISARLEASRAAADLSRAQTEYEDTRKNAERQRMLYREGATPKQVYDKAQAELTRKTKEFEAVREAANAAEESAEQAQKRLDSAKRIVDNINRELEEVNSDVEASQVVSPVNGVITGMAARQGEEVHLGMEAMFQVAVDLSRLTVTLEPTPQQMALLQPGQPVLVYVAELAGQPLEGSLTEMSVGRAVVDFANPSPAIRPGLTAQVAVRVSE